MNWTTKDKRTEEPTSEELRDAEDERQRKRQALRLQIAAMQLKLDRAALLQAEIRTIDDRLDAAADLHTSTTAPLQAELEELEKRAIQRIAARVPANPTEDSRRREIIGEIGEANRQLEEVTQREQALRRPLEQQVHALTIAAASIQPLTSKLSQPPLACPRLLIDAHICQQRIQAATTRIATAQRASKVIRHNVTEIQARRMAGDLAAQRGRLERWEAEEKAATQEQADALALAAKISQAMIDE